MPTYEQILDETKFKPTHTVWEHNALIQKYRHQQGAKPDNACPLCAKGSKIVLM